MKAVKAAPVNIKNVALITAGGGVALLLAAQILAKPNVPTVARAISGTPTSGKSTPTANTAKSTAPVVVTEIPHLKVAADPPIRELFHPLVSRTSATSTQALPGGKAPLLPNANQPSPIIKPDDNKKPETVLTPTPSGPRVSDIQMIGVVEIGGEPKTLLKNTVTGERRYFTKGEDAFGFKVGEIKETETSLIHDGRTERVVMSSAIVIDGPGGAQVASSGPSTGFNRGSFGSGFTRGSTNGSGFSRGNRGSVSDRGSRGGNNGGSGGDTGFSTAQIFSLPTWAERLKKLDEVKAQIEPERYDRLRKFMADKAAEEAKEKK